MPRKPRAKNSITTGLLKLSTTPQVQRALKELVATGYFGKTMSEVGESLLHDRLRELMLEGWTKTRLKGNK